MSIFAFSLILLLGSSLDWVQINLSTKKFVDSYNRTIIFHGVNAVYKIPPFVPDSTNFDPVHSLSELDAQNLSEWGINVVRLGIEWPGVYPSQNNLNETYLQEIDKIITILAKYDIYTLLDFHQDILSRFFCGEGIPDFLVKTLSPAKDFPKPNPHQMDYDNQTGYPTIQSCLKVGNYFELYYSDKVSKGFQDLYNKSTIAYNEFLKFCDSVSNYFSKNSNVLGYELINEPWLGDVYTYP